MQFGTSLVTLLLILDAYAGSFHCQVGQWEASSVFFERAIPLSRIENYHTPRTRLVSIAGGPMSLRFRIAFSAACAVLVALVFLAYGNHVRAEAEQVRSDAIARYGGEVVSLVVATRSLEPGDVVSPSDVQTRDWIADLVPEGSITSVDDAVAREVTVPVSGNAPITELAFRDSSEVAEVPSGKVAVSLAVSDKLGLPRGVRQGAVVSAYQVGQEGARLIASEATVLSTPSAAQGIGSAGQVPKGSAAAPEELRPMEEEKAKAAEPEP